MTEIKVLAVHLKGTPTETLKMTILSTLQLQRPLGDYKGLMIVGDLNKTHIRSIMGFLDMLDEMYEEAEDVRKKTEQ